MMAQRKRSVGSKYCRYIHLTPSWRPWRPREACAVVNSGVLSLSAAVAACARPCYRIGASQTPLECRAVQPQCLFDRPSSRPHAFGRGPYRCTGAVLFSRLHSLRPPSGVTTWRLPSCPARAPSTPRQITPLQRATSCRSRAPTRRASAPACFALRTGPPRSSFWMVAWASWRTSCTTRSWALVEAERTPTSRTLRSPQSPGLVSSAVTFSTTCTMPPEWCVPARRARLRGLSRAIAGSASTPRTLPQLSGASRCAACRASGRAARGRADAACRHARGSFAASRCASSHASAGFVGTPRIPT